MSDEHKDDVQPPAKDDPFGFQESSVEASTGDTGISAGNAEPETAPPVEQLMATGSAPDLDAEALRAAEEAVAKAEVALASAQLASSEPAMAPAADAAENETGRNEWLLRGVLLANLVLLGVMMALPNPDLSEADKTTTEEPKTTPETGAPQVGKTGGTKGAADVIPLPASSPEYLQAIRLAAQDKHAEAAEVLRGYVTANPSLPARDKREYYSAMMFYYGEAGMHKERDASHSKLLALQTQSYLPEDILRFAREAEDEGDAVRMRQLYARFLLTQKNHSAEERRAVAEAYLKLGDSYRIQAERSKVRAMLVQRERESRLKLETRNRRAQKTGDSTGGGK